MRVLVIEPGFRPADAYAPYSVRSYWYILQTKVKSPPANGHKCVTVTQSSMPSVIRLNRVRKERHKGVNPTRQNISAGGTAANVILLSTKTLTPDNAIQVQREAPLGNLDLQRVKI